MLENRKEEAEAVADGGSEEERICLESNGLSQDCSSALSCAQRLHGIEARGPARWLELSCWRGGGKMIPLASSIFDDPFR